MRNDRELSPRPSWNPAPRPLSSIPLLKTSSVSLYRVLVLHEPDCDSAPDSKATMTKIWTLLKSVLFSVVLVSQTILQDLIYEPTPHPLSIANTIIEIFFNLSFVTSKFAGGLTSTGGGFPQQKRCFYGALDVVSSSPSESAELVLRLSSQLKGMMVSKWWKVLLAYDSHYRPVNGCRSPYSIGSDVILLRLCGATCLHSPRM